MSDNLDEDLIMDLDLNQEPLDPSDGLVSGLGFGSSRNYFPSTNVRIEDRIRSLEAASARARQRQRWRQARNSSEMNYTSFVPTADTQHEIGDSNEAGRASVRQNATERDNGKSCKRDCSYLVAKALQMDLDDKKPSNSDSGGNFYDCNICLELAKDPILTCCGHLFCWACFYKLSYVDSASKECPVCKGEVTDSNITPIYGNRNDTRNVSESDSLFKLPPRPRAKRVESVRQQRINLGGASNVPFVEAIRQIRSRIGGLTAGRLVLGASIQNTSVVEPPQIQIMDSTAEINSSSSRTLDGLATVIAMENVTSEMGVENETNALEIHQPIEPARRRTRASRVLDLENGISPELRRRRVRH